MSTALAGAELGLKARSPRTPTQGSFTLDVSLYPLPLSRPNTPRSVSPSIILTGADDVERIPRIDRTPRTTSAQSSPRPSFDRRSLDIPNIPTQSYTYTSRSVSASIPRPVMRVMSFGFLLICCICLLANTPGAQLPSLRAASISRRLAFATNGKAVYDAVHPITSWEQARERDYVPPQIKSHIMMKRSTGNAESIVVRQPGRTVAGHPKADRPKSKPQSLPPSHELLALQSYLLQADNNRLPESIDPLKPLEAHVVLGAGADDQTLKELEREGEDEVVIWYGTDGIGKKPHEHLALLSALHGSERQPTLIPVHGRSDYFVLMQILNRLDLAMDRGLVLVVIGNKPFVANVNKMEEMRGSGQLEKMLDSIGWIRHLDAEAEEAEKRKRSWKPKFNKWEKKEATTELEMVINLAREE
ncbi:hypothetical protein BD324DRAFT_652884 [Kockovaella imperatae]|uniref:Uncharacterized protein n=1 Tax=Kockovaella imperatae TaxID=4999 RepID=A0A1Y1UAZ7_9TREE|nr:hypothetical protein BD324DRAFT_652884 [Kockovaella imperatae]ORX35172.1 hypothetical protein BD324DRAFT_652884 [Kockovaella imperatae]